MNKKELLESEVFHRFMFDSYMKPVIAAFSMMETLMDNIKELVPLSFYVPFSECLYEKVTEALEERVREAREMEKEAGESDGKEHREAESILDCLRGI